MISPPKLAEKLLRLLASLKGWDPVVDDLGEAYQNLRGNRSRLYVNFWYWGHTFRFVPGALRNAIYWRMTVFQKNIKLALRHLLKNRGYTAINIFGLAVGLAACILIFLWIRYEFSVNTFHENFDNIQWVRCREYYDADPQLGWGCVPAMSRALREEYPEIQDAALLEGGQGERLFTVDGQRFKERVQLAEPSVFSVFSFPLISGNVSDAQGDPHVAILSQTMAQRFFGDEDPVGQTVTFDNDFDLRIIGVMEDIPENSTIHFDIWMPMSMTRELYRPNYPDTWTNLGFRLYAVMNPETDIAAFNKKISGRIRQSHADTILEPFLYPFKDMYLKEYGVEDQIRLFTTIGLLILIIACVNFVNLSTARSARRALEVGLRKVVGARRTQLMSQFLGESTLVALTAMIFALILVLLLLPFCSRLMDAEIPVSMLWQPETVAALFGLVLVTGLIAGSYPALLLSSLQPVAMLKRSLRKGKHGAGFRKVLVVFQFTISILLIVGALVTMKQTRFVKNKDLGFTRDQILYIPLEGDLKEKRDAFKQTLISHSDVISATVTSHSPSGVWWNGNGWEWEGKDPGIDPLVTILYADEDFLKTFDISMAEGAFYNKESIHQTNSIIINQRMAEIMAQDEIIGARLWDQEYSLSVLGVIRDFHYIPVTRRIGPLIVAPVYVEDHAARYLFIKISPENVESTLGFIKETTRRFNPQFPFEYHFLDEDFERMYRTLDQRADMYQSFSILAVLISVLGLFGLSAFMAQQRTKEIGIRRVLGARATGITGLLVTDFLKWVVVANLFAWPLAYYYLKNWLAQYPYRIHLTASPFVSASVLALFMAFVAVAYQSVKAALVNPAESIRCE